MLLGGQAVYYDDLGLIVHQGGDAGDTAQREGWYWLGVWIRQTVLHQPWATPRALTFPQVLSLLEPKGDGVFHRHPRYAADDHDVGFSRDQMVPLVAAMGVWGTEGPLRRLWNALPQDFLGKHTFNGGYRNYLGQPRSGCQEIRERGCDATKDCSLKVDTRDCSLSVDTRDCSLLLDTRDCEPHWNCRSCDGLAALDPVCQAQKVGCEADKGRYKLQCETAKGTQNGLYKGQHDACELAKATQNGVYKVAHDACEAAKGAQNALYKMEHDACEIEKAAAKLSCEADKFAAYNLCWMTTIHSGDFVGPMTINLFRRAWNENPLIAGDGNGPGGETELMANVLFRLGAAAKDRDDVGDDLNLMVMMLMAKLRYPSPVSELATSVYAGNRDMSFGSYLRAYYHAYGDDATAMKDSIANGIRSGWQPECSAPLGAVRWYHRAASGANPALSVLYGPIIEYYIK